MLLLKTLIEKITMKAVKYIHKRNNKLIEYSFLKFMAIQALNNMSLIAINIVSVAKEYL